jgi:hypothetical protein
MEYAMATLPCRRLLFAAPAIVAATPLCGRILATPAIQGRLGGMGVEVAPESTGALARRLRADAEKWGH